MKSTWLKFAFCFSLLFLLGMDATSTFRSVDLDESEEQCVSGPSRVMSFTAMNLNAEDTLYVHFYDALIANVTVGTTVPKLTYAIPPGGGLHMTVPNGVRFDTGVAAACTATLTGADAPGTNEMVLNVYYLSP